MTYSVGVQVMPSIADTNPTTYPNLLAWRTAARLSQQEAADLFGITQSYYAKIERREEGAAGKLAIKMATKTGSPIELIVVAA